MSDSYKIIYSFEALQDLKNIYAYIAYELNVVEIAQKQLDRIRKEIRSLDIMPMRYTIVDWEPWKSMGMHKIPLDNYVIYYVVNMDCLIVTIVRIFYKGQDAESIVKSEE